jgi:hypothetical protein
MLKQFLKFFGIDCYSASRVHYKSVMCALCGNRSLKHLALDRGTYVQTWTGMM